MYQCVCIQEVVDVCIHACALVSSFPYSGVTSKSNLQHLNIYTASRTHILQTGQQTAGSWALLNAQKCSLSSPLSKHQIHFHTKPTDPSGKDLGKRRLTNLRTHTVEWRKLYDV